MIVKHILKLAVLSLSILSLNCTSHTNCLGLNDAKDSIINITHTHNKTVLPYDSFVKLVKNVSDKNGNPLYSSVASGIVLSHGSDHTKILTARHFCTSIEGKESTIPEELYPLKDETVIIDVEKNIHTMLFYTFDDKQDICAVITKKIEQPAIVLSPVAPQRGEKVFNIAAPLGISDGKAVLLFEGYYAGDLKSPLTGLNSSLYSIPTKSGSSGSAILNEHGELIGITYAGVSEFESICIAVPWKDLKRFIEFIESVPVPKLDTIETE
jgi:S1-C subfamily serine protease